MLLLRIYTWVYRKLFPDIEEVLTKEEKRRIERLAIKKKTTAKN